MMNRPPLGPDPSQMSRDELLRQLQNARNEIQQLRQENQQLSNNNNNNNNNNRNSFANNNGGNNSNPNSRPSSANSNTSSNGGFNRFNQMNGKQYSVSMNVLVISGTQEHKCRTLPLETVLQKGNIQRQQQGGYEREADTPINQMMAANAPHQNPYKNNNNNNQNNNNDPFARHSLDLNGHQPRFSAIGSNDWNQRNSSMSSNGFDFGGTGSNSNQNMHNNNNMMNNNNNNMNQNSATRLSALSPGGDGSSTMNSNTNQGRPVNMNINSLRNLNLDTDSLVSNNTLHAFARNNAEAPLSPQSMTATAMLKYLQETFAGNKYQHEGHPRQMEAVGRSLLSICADLERTLVNAPPHPEIASPVYVFGDIHGNFADLNYFMSTIMNFGDMRFVPLNVLFLGDYVDRGPHGVEVVAFLFALKVLAPHKITLLRGNHEDTLVNGDLNLYRDTSFRYQCRNLFGDLLGEEVWMKCNRVFACLPLTASIDKKIFCTHGGLPRYNGGPDNRMEMLRSRDPPRLESFFQVPENESKMMATYRQLACDVCWSDPAEDERMVDEHGFGNNPRGAGVILFGSNAVDRFLNNFGFEYIFRAHQEKSDGLKISKNAKVVTVFSTSGYVGHQNGAGVVYVADGKIRLIIKEHEEEGVKPSDD